MVKNKNENRKIIIIKKNMLKYGKIILVVYWANKCIENAYDKIIIMNRKENNVYKNIISNILNASSPKIGLSLILRYFINLVKYETKYNPITIIPIVTIIGIKRSFNNSNKFIKS
jgi:hypothetical protein